MGESNQPPHAYLIAYSGGLDSHVLLHSMVRLRERRLNIQLRAAHIHHGISRQADQWLEHCKAVCAELAVPFVSAYLSYSSNRSSFQPHADSTLINESTLRTLRYQALSTLLQPDEVLITAHTEDDQAETLLLQLLRGAGLPGLSAMPAEKSFAHSALCRPFLRVSRADLEQYAAHYQLQWIEDPSNQDVSIRRNFLRHDILPRLKKHWPSAHHVLARSAAHCAEAEEILADCAKTDLTQCMINKHQLSIKNLSTLSEARQRNVLRYWLKKLNLPLPPRARLLEIQKSLIPACQDASPCVHWEGAEIRRYRDGLYALIPGSIFNSQIVIPWCGSVPLELPCAVGGVDPIFDVPQDDMTVRFRQGGESIALIKQGITKSLKSLLQEAGVPPWLRNQVPLVYQGDRVVAVVIARYLVLK